MKDKKVGANRVNDFTTIKIKTKVIVRVNWWSPWPSVHNLLETSKNRDRGKLKWMEGVFVRHLKL